MKRSTWKTLLFTLIVIAAITFPAVSAAQINSRLYLPVVIKGDPPEPTLPPLPSPTATPEPGPTPPPTSEVAVLSSTAFVPYQGSSSLYIAGEIINNTSSNVRFVKIHATLRDANGNVVDSDYTYSDIDILIPEMKSPFMVLLWDPPAWSSYELSVTWSTTYEHPHALEILNHTTYFDSFDAFHVVGEIRNQYDTERSYIKAFVTLYDTNGQVIGVDYSYTNPHTLAPGQAASFDVDVYFWAGKPDRNLVGGYALQVLDD
jgi:hypothetical protein